MYIFKKINIVFFGQIRIIKVLYVLKKNLFVVK